MIDVSHHIRKAYIDLLTGITLNAVAVPVFDEMDEEGDNDNYIIIASQIDTDDSTKHSFQSDHVINIDIVTRFITSARKYPSEVIAGQVLNLVLPTPSTTGLVSPSGLQITSVRKLDDQSVSVEQFDTYKIVRKILRFSHKCVQI